MTDYSKIIAEDTETLRRMQAKTECPHCVELKAQTAAMLEKAEMEIRKFAVDENKAIAKPHITSEEEATEDRYWRRATNRILDIASENVRRLIPADYAAALAERDDKLIGEALSDATTEIGKTGKLTIQGTVIDFLSYSPWLAERVREAVLTEHEQSCDQCAIHLLDLKAGFESKRQRGFCERHIELAAHRAAARVPEGKK